MKNLNRWFATVAFVGMSAMAPAFSQIQTTLRADVPFDFVVHGKTMPAGQYTISEAGDRAVVVVRHTGGNEAAAVITIWTSTGKIAEDSKLVFRLGANDHYFLTKIQTAGYELGHEVPLTSAQREALASTPVVFASVKAVRQ